jgi:thymidine phosphorylase
MVDIGKACGRNMAALITSMDVPLGCAIGNALEVQEAIAVLKGESHGALREVCEALAAQIVSLTFGWSAAQAACRVREALDSGEAFKVMRAWIAAQGGDVSYIDDPSLFPKAPYVCDVLASCDGYVAAMDAEQIGHAAVLLGAGRLTKEDAIDHRAGIVLHKTRGDRVCKGDVLCTLYSGDETALAQVTAHVERAITYQEQKPTDMPLVYAVVR